MKHVRSARASAIGGFVATTLGLAALVSLPSGLRPGGAGGILPDVPRGPETFPRPTFPVGSTPIGAGFPGALGTLVTASRGAGIIGILGLPGAGPLPIAGPVGSGPSGPGGLIPGGSAPNGSASGGGLPELPTIPGEDRAGIPDDGNGLPDGDHGDETDKDVVPGPKGKGNHDDDDDDDDDDDEGEGDGDDDSDDGDSEDGDDSDRKSNG
jgi:hypothetical protein